MTETPHEAEFSSKSGSESRSSAYSSPRSSSVGQEAIPTLSPAARELVGFALAVAGQQEVTGDHVLLASLVREPRTRLNRADLTRGASHALIEVLGPDAGDRVEAAMRVFGLRGSSFDNLRQTGGEDPRIAPMLARARALADKVGARSVFSHHFLATALEGGLDKRILEALHTPRHS
jgi:hypothetical protein